MTSDFRFTIYMTEGTIFEKTIPLTDKEYTIYSECLFEFKKLNVFVLVIDNEDFYFNPEYIKYITIKKVS